MMLREHARLHALDVWRTYADAFEGEIMIRQGNVIEGVAPLRGAIRSLEVAGFVLYNSAFEGVLAEGLMASGRDDEAEAIVASALARCKRTGAVWCVPELMRIRALSLARNRTEEAIGLVIDGLEIARSQGALAWELKLASTLVEINDKDGTRDVLRDTLNRTREGFGTRDYRDAVGRLNTNRAIA
jgi:predicted ATPase